MAECLANASPAIAPALSGVASSTSCATTYATSTNPSSLSTARRPPAALAAAFTFISTIPAVTTLLARHRHGRLDRGAPRRGR